MSKSAHLIVIGRLAFDDNTFFEYTDLTESEAIEKATSELTQGAIEAGREPDDVEIYIDGLLVSDSPIYWFPQY